MIVKNGPLVVVVGVILSVIVGGLGFYFSGESLLVTLIAAVVPLILCTLYANFLSVVHRRRAAVAPAAPPPAADYPTPAAAPATRLGLLRSAFFYLTLGTLTVIWSGLWYWYLGHHAPARDVVWYVCEGLILTGLLLMVIGGVIYRMVYHVNPRRPAAPGF